MNMTTMNEPKLAPPGAGLPAIELRIARLIFAFHKRSGGRADFTHLIEEELRQILELCAATKVSALQERVLIKRLKGLEDSSRYWSVCMVAEHLRIVNSMVKDVMLTLAKGVTPPMVASTAAVKPSPESGLASIGGFESATRELLAATAKLETLETKARFAHPWFGPLTALEWYAMVGFHMRLHRKQMLRILEARG